MDNQEFILVDIKEKPQTLLAMFQVLGLSQLMDFAHKQIQDTKLQINRIGDLMMRADMEDDIRTIKNNITKLRKAYQIGMN